MVKRVCEVCNFTEEKEETARWNMEWKGIRSGRVLCRTCYYKETGPERRAKKRAQNLRRNHYAINGEY